MTACPALLENPLEQQHVFCRPCLLNKKQRRRGIISWLRALLFFKTRFHSRCVLQTVSSYQETKIPRADPMAVCPLSSLKSKRYGTMCPADRVFQLGNKHFTAYYMAACPSSSLNSKDDNGCVPQTRVSNTKTPKLQYRQKWLPASLFEIQGRELYVFRRPCLPTKEQRYCPTV